MIHAKHLPRERSRSTDSADLLVRDLSTEHPVSSAAMTIGLQ